LFQGSQQLRSCIIAREVSGYRTRFEAIEKGLDDVEREHHEVGMERDPPQIPGGAQAGVPAGDS
jgi:hypothetical protein